MRKTPGGSRNQPYQGSRRLLGRSASSAAPPATGIDHVLPGHLIEPPILEIMEHLLESPAGGLDLGISGCRNLGSGRRR